jgi:hypothetical protein
VAKTPPLLYGSIVHVAQVTDARGNDAGPHFGVVLNTAESIEAGEDLRLAMISTRYSYPVRDGWFELDNTPGKRGGHDKTGMSEACVAKGTWLRMKPQADVKNEGKRAPVAIANKLNAFIDQGAAARRNSANPPSA